MATSKKETVDLTVEQRLKKLYELQTMLSEIDRIKILRGELPLEVQDLEDEIEGMTHRVGKYTEDVETSKPTSRPSKTKSTRRSRPSTSTTTSCTT